MQTRLAQVFSTLCCCLMLHACTTVEEKNTHVIVAGGGVFTLLPAETLARSLLVTQRVQGRFKTRKFVMLAQLEVNQNRLAMVGVTPSGNTLFSLQYMDGLIDIERSSWLPEQLQPAYMLADIQMIFWPLLPLKKQLSNAGLAIAENITETSRVRRIYHAGQLVIEIVYDSSDLWQGAVQFINRQWDYSYTIETVQVEKL